ncbi:MAG: DUF3488 domain-containing protein [Rhodocyclaceae bacterium]|nr:DUF3488 domain-containing protein [Rhodocyclaceae bacterium]
MSFYPLLKHLHVTCVVLSGAGFLLRGILMWRDSLLLQRRWMKIVPHVNDSLLLAAAIALAIILGQYPLLDGWLTAKVAGLIVYVILGSVGLKRGRTRHQRGLAVAAAMVAFLYVVSVALTKNPWGALVLIGAGGA